MSMLLRCLLLLCVSLGTGEAVAGTLYRCLDKNGVTAYTSSRDGYRQCKLVGNFPASPRPAASAPPQRAGSPAAGSSAVEFRSAAGAAEPASVTVPAGTKPKVQRGAVYKYTKDGVTHYTNRRPAGHRAQVLFTYIETCFACGAAPGLDFHSVALNLTAFADEIGQATAIHAVDPALVRAVMHAESAFNPNAVSRAGAQGLMQLSPATASRFGVESAFDPAQNVAGGVAYLAWLMKRFDGDMERVAAGYNAGEGAVDRYQGIPPYEETMRYVERVGILHDRYKTALAGAGALIGATAGGATSSGSN
jgi:hypothetical protein